MGESDGETTPQDHGRRLANQAEKQTADAFEQLVHRDSFGELLARTTENVMGLTKIGFDAMDLVVRNLRLAGRPDLVRLGKQLARNEDKLERVLQEVEQLQQQVKDPDQPRRSRPSSSARRSGASSSAKNGSTARRRKSSSGSGAKSKR